LKLDIEGASIIARWVSGPAAKKQWQIRVDDIELLRYHPGQERR
jgi:hypothetical protein